MSQGAQQWSTIRAEVESALGAAVTATEPVQGRHGLSRCWRVSAGDRMAYLKLFDSGRGFDQERDFYRFASGLSGIPQVLECWDNPRAILLSGVVGKAPEPDQDEPHEAAGRWLKALHALPLDDNDTPLLEALRSRIAGFQRRAVGHLHPEGIERVAGPLLELLEQRTTLSRVMCHRDYAEYNWLCGSEGFSVIDFEHSKADFHLLDLCLLTGTTFARRPSAADAFWQGYGVALDDWEAEFLRRWTLLWAQETRIWGERHRDQYCRDLGIRVLEAL